MPPISITPTFHYYSLFKLIIMLRSFLAFSLVSLVIILSGCTKENLFDGDVEFKKKKAPPTSLPCATAFLSQNNPPGSVITIKNVATNAIVSNFTVGSSGSATDYVTLETGQTYQWVTSISLPGQVLYCSCDNNHGVLQHGPSASKFTTTDIGLPYTECSF